MQPSAFDECAFFAQLQTSGARALLIGRRALVLLGLPVLTADYDFWLHMDDIAIFNRVGASFELHPTRTPEEARASGRYVLENDEHVDVLVARSLTTTDGHLVAFEDLWSRRRAVRIGLADIQMPTVDDLILTKQVAARPKDLEDIRLLRILSEQSS